jgi:predicted RNA-binding Zn-ribbon protein involved in translation (DUF1610 family)
MVKIADIHTLRCPKCGADIASRAGGSGAAFYGLADEFSCPSCGTPISLSPEERGIRDYITSLANRRRAFMLKVGGSLAGAVLLLVLLLLLLGLPPLASIPVAFFALLVAAFITTSVTKSRIG